MECFFAILFILAGVHCAEHVTSVGDTISLNCFLPSDSLQWSEGRWNKDNSDSKQSLAQWRRGDKNNLVLTDKRLVVDDQTFALTINGVQPIDSGVYYCQALLHDVIVLQQTSRVIVAEADTQQVTKPNPPSQPNVFVIDEDKIQVQWQYNGDANTPAYGYRVYLRMCGATCQNWDEVSYLNSDSTVLVVQNLLQQQSYQARVSAVNSVGVSDFSLPSDIVLLAEKAPTGKPRIVSIEGFNKYIILKMHPPSVQEMNGKLLGYMVTAKACDGNHEVKYREASTLSTIVNITALNPHTCYKLSITAYNRVGEGPAWMNTTVTDEGVPSKPRITHIKHRNDTAIQLEWEQPKDLNGRLLGYHVFWEFNKTSFSSIVLPDNTTEDESGIMTFTIDKLLPYTEYDLQVAAFTQKGIGEKSDKYPGLTDVRAPSAPEDVLVSSNISGTIDVKWKRPHTVYKQIDRFIIRWAIAGPGDFKLYDEVTVLNTNMMKQQQQIAIQGLQPGTVYEVEVAGESKSIFYDIYYTGKYSSPILIEVAGAVDVTEISVSKPPTTTFPVAGVIIGCIVCCAVLFAGAFISLMLRRYIKARYRLIRESDANKGNHMRLLLPESFDAADCDSIALNEFAEHVRKNHSDGDLGFSQEFESLAQCVNFECTYLNGLLAENKAKNRYQNILPYDHSRVVLRQMGKAGSDYINANYVDGFHRPKAYIATQGPLTSTFTDFWRMVWEQNCSVIVMITNLMEKGRRKCDQYWPAEGDHMYGFMHVRLLSTVTMAHYTVRILSVSNYKMSRRKSSHERIVTQFHYTDWPDHGVPDYCLPVLTFVRKSSAACSESTGPIIVHCSAGVGRTGTYIVIDSMIRQMKEKGTVSVNGFLQHIRKQRNYLVQTEDQYVFIHDALLEWHRGGDSEVKLPNLSQYINDLTALDDFGSSLLKRQYEMATSFIPQEYDLSIALKSYNVAKNRSVELIPVEKSRVELPMIAGSDGSDYINASFVQGYNRIEEYIITQLPLENTTEDFWRMVWHHNCMTIVTLHNSDTAEESFVFWPLNGAVLNMAQFKVTLTEEQHQSNHVIRDFILQSLQDEYEYTCRMFSITYWPDTCSPLSTVFELVHMVKKWHAQHDDEGPVIAIDRLGGGKAAVFCALSTLCDQLLHDNTADIYHVVSLYHMKRPGVFSNKKDYEFLYRAMESISEMSLPDGDVPLTSNGCNTLPLPLTSTYPDSQTTALIRHSYHGGSTL